MRAALLALLMLVGCEQEEGPYRAVLLLEAEDGRLVEFALGGRNSYDACADMGAYEAAAYEEDGFWANSDLSYGGYRDGDDWALYRVLGFACRWTGSA